MAQLSFSSLFKRRGTTGQAEVKEEMAECPRCGRFFHKRGHEHEPLCKDCWKLEKSAGNS